MTNTNLPPNIVVTTPTGNIGSRVAQLLIQSGVRPTLLVRDAGKLSVQIREAANVIEGDLLDPEFLTSATKEADAFFLLVPSNYASDDPYGEILKVGENAAAAIKRNNIARTVLLSSQGAQLPKAGFISRLGEVEKLINAAGENVLTLRPAYFYTNLLSSLEEIKHGVYSKIGSLDVKTAWNDPRDIGDIAAAILLNNTWTGRSIQFIDGAEDLTWNEVAALITKATGKEVRAIETTAEEMRGALTGAGLPPAVASAFVEMSEGVADGVGERPTRSFVTTTPTKLESWIYENLRPVLA